MPSEPRSPTMEVRVSGDMACWTAPEFKTERVTYPVMTPSASRGILEAVLWKPAIRWWTECIIVLRPIRFISFLRNEVNKKAAAPSRKIMGGAGPPPCLAADDSANRAQRNTVALYDVDYVIRAYFTLTKSAGSDDNLNKFTEMFKRRLRKGQHFHQPYLGCREFPARVSPADGHPPPVDDTRDLGMMLWDIDYNKKNNEALFFPARLDNGVLHVPQDRNALFTQASENGGAA